MHISFIRVSWKDKATRNSIAKSAQPGSEFTDNPNRAEPDRTGPGPGGARQQGWLYQPNALERHTSSILGWASVLWSLSYYTSPLLVFYLYRKGYICLSKLVPVGQYTGTLLILLLGVACLRGIGRWTNPEYVQFITILEESKNNNSPGNKEGTVPRGRVLAEARAKTQRGDGQRSELDGKAAVSDYQLLDS
ncbi:phosphatidylserine lipase ABHD16A-like [Polyodon spathula]|uniref:phosphatidylserine lipase ABHD16A-like n=1 Tax=Polyodon spathula TaxID=7913 RepID=UPI001B7DFC7B|nr:phosphatidylserine lipase ABHD16A-like [Polyodon spathula]